MTGIEPAPQTPYILGTPQTMHSVEVNNESNTHKHLGKQFKKSCYITLRRPCGSMRLATLMASFWWFMMPVLNLWL
jgi:hypothetical protein